MAGFPAVALDPTAIRAQLERILSSPLFLRAPFAQKFLRYVVEAELAGSAADIKEYRIGVDVFDRGSDFDPKADTVVRVEGLRLRKRLADYYAAEGIADAVIIDVPKGAYRAVFSPRVAAEPVPAAAPILPRSTAVASPRFGRRALAIACLAVVLPASGAYLMRDREPICSWIRQRPCQMHVAVLPFRSIGGDPAGSALADGLLHVLSGKLGSIEGADLLSVVPAADVIASGATASDDARRRLGANLVVSGSVERSADRTRVVITLTDPIRKRQLRAQTLDLAGREPTSLEDEVLLATVHLLNLELNPNLRSTLTSGVPRTPGANEFYVRGRGHLERGNNGADDAIVMFQEAIARDANYALAYSGLAEALLLKYEDDKDPRWIELAVGESQKAVKLEPRQPDIRIVAGILARRTGKPDQAIADFRQAIAMDPRSWRAQHELATVFEELGQTLPAEETFRRAIAVRPDYWGGHAELGRFFIRQGRYSEADASFRQALAAAPENPDAISGLATALISNNRPAEAIPWLKQAALMKPRNTMYSALAAAYESLGQYEEMTAALEKSVALRPNALYPLYSLGRAYRLTHSSKARETFARLDTLAKDFVRVNPTSTGARSLHAMTLAELGRCPEAIESARDSLRVPAPAAFVRRHVVFVYEKCARRDLAISNLLMLASTPQTISSMQKDPDLRTLFADPSVRKSLGTP